MWQSRASVVGDHFLYSHDLNVCSRGDIVRRSQILVTFWGLKVEQKKLFFLREKDHFQFTIKAQFLKTEAWNISKITCCSLLLSNFPLMSRKSCYCYKYSSFCVVTCSKAVFQCLDVLLKLNHSLVEPYLDVIWKMLWRTECSAGDAHNSLMNSLISTYVKLRQVQHILCTVHLPLTEAVLKTG